MKITAAAVFAAGFAAAGTTFSVSNFTASCVQKSAQCLYDFILLQTDTTEITGVDCSVMALSDGSGILPSIPETPCIQSSRTFSINRTECGLTLTVAQPLSPKDFLMGNYIIPKNHLQYVQDGSTFAENYVGPKQLNLGGLFPPQ